jgi:hypothetical protein
MIGPNRSKGSDAARVIAGVCSDDAGTNNREIEKQARPARHRATHTLGTTPQNAAACAWHVGW